MGRVKLVALGDLMVRRGGSVDPSKFPNEEFELYSIPAYDVAKPEILLGSNIGSSKKVIEENDVLLSKIVPHIRRCWVVGKKYNRRLIGSGEWIQFRGDSFLPNYLRHYLMSDGFHTKFMGTITGVGGSLLRANPSLVEKFEIPLPPLSEQKRIASLLDTADALRQQNKALIAQYNQLAQSLFLEMFGDFSILRSKYPIVELGSITNKITDGVHAKPNYTSHGVPFISVKDITTGKLLMDECKYVSQQDHEQFSKRCKVEPNDILYTKVGATYGRAAIVDAKQEFSLYVSVALIKPKLDMVNPMYLKEAMASPATKAQADKSIKGIGVPDLHLNMIRKFTIPLPPLSLQEKFASLIENIEGQKSATESALRESEALFQRLLQDSFA